MSLTVSTEHAFVPSYQILQTAASSAGLMQHTYCNGVERQVVVEPPQKKKSRKKANKMTEMKPGQATTVDFTTCRPCRLPNTIKIVDNAEAAALAAAANNLSTFPSAVIAVNGQFPNNGFISIPTGLTSESTVTVPNAVNAITLQAFQHQLQQQQQQQQLQLQIQLLQQQLQNSQNATLAAQAAQTIRHSTEATEYIVTPTVMEQTVGTPVVVQTVTTPAQASVIQNVVTQSLVPNVMNTETGLPTIVAQTNSQMADFLTPTANMNILQAARGNQTKVASNISLVTSPVRNPNEISILTQNNPVVLNTATNMNETTLSEQRVTQPVTQQVHLIAATQPTPTVAISQPITISLQQPSLSLPTMLLTSTSQEQLLQQQQQQQQLIMQQTTATPQIQRAANEQQLIIQRATNSQPHVTPTVAAAPSQLIVQQSPLEHNNAILTNSLLPPITSFNADAFLTSVTSEVEAAYTVVSNNSISDMQ